MLERIVECFPEKTFVTMPEYDKAIIGVCEQSERLIYSRTLILEHLVVEGLSIEDALDHLYFNIIGSSNPEMKTPIICLDDVL